MPPGNIVASTRYVRYGTTVIYWCPTIANKSAPTRGELNGGTNLAPEVADNSGWSTETADQETPDLASRFVSKIPGRINSEQSSITFYASQNSIDVRGLLVRDSNGFIVWLDEGDVTGRKMDVFPVRIGSVPKDRSLEEASRIMVNFSITSEPAENVTVPA